MGSRAVHRVITAGLLVGCSRGEPAREPRSECTAFAALELQCRPQSPSGDHSIAYDVAIDFCEKVVYGSPGPVVGAAGAEVACAVASKPVVDTDQIRGCRQYLDCIDSRNAKPRSR